MHKKNVLVAPLNWGLGHSTRCIPIIRQLVARGHEVHIGSDGVALALLKQEFSLDCKFKNYKEAYKAVKQAIFIYNNYRKHWSLGLSTPIQIHRAA